MQRLGDLAILYAGLASCCGLWYSRPKRRGGITSAEKMGIALVVVAGLLGTIMIVFHLDNV